MWLLLWWDDENSFLEIMGHFIIAILEERSLLLLKPLQVWHRASNLLQCTNIVIWVSIQIRQDKRRRPNSQRDLAGKQILGRNSMPIWTDFEEFLCQFVIFKCCAKHGLCFDTEIKCMKIMYLFCSTWLGFSNLEANMGFFITSHKVLILS